MWAMNVSADSTLLSNINTSDTDNLIQIYIFDN